MAFRVSSPRVLEVNTRTQETEDAYLHQHRGAIRHLGLRWDAVLHQPLRHFTMTVNGSAPESHDASGESQGICWRSKRATSACPFPHAALRREKPPDLAWEALAQCSRSSVVMSAWPSRQDMRSGDVLHAPEWQLRHGQSTASLMFCDLLHKLLTWLRIHRTRWRKGELHVQAATSTRSHVPLCLRHEWWPTIFAAFARILNCRIELKRTAVSCKVVEDSVPRRMLSQTCFPKASRRYGDGNTLVLQCARGHLLRKGWSSVHCGWLDSLQTRQWE